VRPSVQIGGKFTVLDNGIFVLKRALLAAGVDVSHPLGDSIKTNVSGMSLSIDLDTVGFSLFDLEIDYLRHIAQSSLHIVHNKVGTDIGYVGESAAVEICYAILKNRNICLLHKPIYSSSVPRVLTDILELRQSTFHVKRIDLLEGDVLLNAVSQLSQSEPHYNLNPSEVQAIKRQVCLSLRKYRASC
jgi:hypothetical protein